MWFWKFSSILHTVQCLLHSPLWNSRGATSYLGQRIENIYGVEMNRVHVSPPPWTHVHLYNIGIQHKGAWFGIIQASVLRQLIQHNCIEWNFTQGDQSCVCGGMRQNCKALGGGRIWQKSNTEMFHQPPHTHYICSTAAMFKTFVVVVTKLSSYFHPLPVRESIDMACPQNSCHLHRIPIL